MRSRAISRGEAFTRDNESSSIRTEVLEKVAETIEGEQALGIDLVETESNDTEKDREHSKTADLNRFAADGIDGCNRNPVARDKTGG